MRKLLTLGTAVISLAAATQAKADGLDLIRGRVTHESGYTRIVLGLKNNTDHVINMAVVECGFFQNSELASSGNAIFSNVQPGQTAYDDVVGSGEKVTRHRLLHSRRGIIQNKLFLVVEPILVGQLKGKPPTVTSISRQIGMPLAQPVGKSAEAGAH
jgi:hypothetical protein